MTTDDLMLLPADEIDYAALDAARLVEMAAQEAEPFIATRALGELLEREDPAVWPAAERVLESEASDPFSISFALYALWNTDVQRSIAPMSRVLGSAPDSKILGTMVEAVLVYPEHFEAGAGRDFRDALVERVRTAEPGRFTDPDDWKAFLGRYG